MMGTLESISSAASVLQASQIWKRLNTCSSMFRAGRSPPTITLSWGCLGQKFQHEIPQHIDCFQFIAVVAQLAINAGKNLFNCVDTKIHLITKISYTIDNTGLTSIKIMRTTGIDGVKNWWYIHSQSSRQPICRLILITYERIPTH